MTKKDNFQMSHSQIKSGIKKALSNSLTLVGYSKDILERGGDSALSLGLYSFAIEEYGKADLLNEIASAKQKEYSVPIVFFTGKKSHDLKFKKALSTLPKQCIEFEAGLAISTPNLTKTENFKVGSHGESASVSAGTTGTFSVSDILIDFETRMNCFYLDWDDQQKKWKKSPKVLPEVLIKSINEFEDFVNTKLDSAYDSKE